MCTVPYSLLTVHAFRRDGTPTHQEMPPMMLSKTFLRLMTTAALSAVLWSCDSQEGGQAAGGARPAPEVTVITAAPQTLRITERLPGRTVAYRSAEVRPQVNGIILKRLFEEGTEVTEGQQLYQIDPATYQASLDSAKAQLAKADATVKSARAKASRYGELVKLKAVSRQDYDDVTATLAESVASVAEAQAAVDAAKINLAYTRVTAPISGRIGRSAITEGALVTANQATTLATITQLDPINVDLTQSSDKLLKLRSQMANGTVQAPERVPVTLQIDNSGTPYGLTGTLQFSEVVVDETTGTVRLRATFPNPNRILLPGLFVRATVDFGSRENVFLVPQRAIVRDAGGNAAVWVIGEGDKAERRAVTAETTQGTNWVVTEGLKGGERIVIAGLQSMAPGAQVKAVAAPPAGQEAGQPAGGQPAPAAK
ncbi:efflux transporter periplasmic adaptor subunit [Rhodospirillum rubrum]|nr:efflux transporter periplasmic adaptor subunit [Rhodospirillum rubrum]MBK1676621.1 efflux transporter periplasmic adaptor subunit [Rhodospirillum rubrum]